MAVSWWHSVARMVAALGLLLAVGSEQAPDGALGADAAPPAVIRGEGTAEAAEPRDIIWNVELDGAFVPTIEQIVPEWSRVEAGDIIAELYTPWLEDELRDEEQQLRRAEAGAYQTEAEARTALAELASSVLTARSELRGTEEHLAALKALPRQVDVILLAARVEEKKAQQAEAKDRLALLRELEKEGLCSDAELAKARHEQESREAEAAHLQGLRERLDAQGSSFDTKRAAANVLKLRRRLEAAELRCRLESERRRLLCDASRETELAQAQREYDLSLKRTEALTVRAPASGHLLYGRDSYYHDPGSEAPCPGKPVYYGRILASIIAPGQVRVETKITEGDLLGVAVGDRAEVEFPSVPGRVYEGVVETVLPIIEASRTQLVETTTEVIEKHGRVKVAVSDADERVRPGMKARVRIFPASAGDGHQDPVPPVADGPHARPAVVLRGHLETESTHLIRCPFQGRVVSVAATGTLVEEGATLATLNPGLAVDWRAQDRSELDRLEALRKAAELQVRLKEQLVPLLEAEAEADVELAELEVQELDCLPEAPQRIKAENELAEAEWQLQWANRKLEACRDLLAQGLSHQSELRQRELQVARAQAGVAEAQARLHDVLAGAPELERVAARANLKLARASLDKTRTLAELDLKAAKAQLQTATARLEAFRAQAERRLRKAGQAQVVSPVRGLVRWCWAEEGTELRAGWHFMAVADMERAVVHAMLDESDYFKVVPGAPARVELAGVLGRAYSGRVADVISWPELAQWTRQYVGETRVRSGQLFRVVVELDEEPPMCVGMSATVELLSPPTGQDARSVSRSDDEPQEGATDGQAD